MAAFRSDKVESPLLTPIDVEGSFLPKGSSAVTAWTGAVESVTREATGRYTVLLKKEFWYLLNRIVTQQGTIRQSAVGTNSHNVSFGPVTAASGTFEVYTHLVSTGAAADLADNANNIVFFTLRCKHSATDDGSGVT